MKRKKIIIPALAIMSTLAIGTLTACSSQDSTAPIENEEVEISQNNTIEEPNETTIIMPEERPAVQPVAQKVSYISVNTEGVNIRTGAGTGYSSLGNAQKGTLMALCGKTGSWYKTYYKGKDAYISSNYCTIVDMDKQSSEIEKVIEEGCKYLGTKYVYGAVRYHDGTGKKLSGFTTTAFDCSSLMQYIFKLGAGKNLQVNTRTQIYQGDTVKKSDLKRGDLIFFTNASRKYNTGVERVGHVAMYLGDNYILHTASDFAKIEQISTTRWSYYIQAQRMI
ncbi:MAG: C40 family peptidase [Clostridia bacterium]|nr:C40 family peptidase [Clostridia bacterium]